MLRHTVFLVESLCAAFFLWLGLYIVSRDLPWNRGTPRGWRGPTLLAGSGLILLALYLYGVAVETVPKGVTDYVYWLQITRWTIPVAIALFFWATIQLIYEDARIPLWLGLTTRLVLAFALLLAAGIITRFVLDVENIQQPGTLFQPYFVPTRQPFRHIFTIFVNGGLLVIFVLLFYQYQRSMHNQQERQKYALLSVGILFGLIGSMVNYGLAPLAIAQLPKQIGDYIATIGAAIIGFGIARCNALEHEQIVEQDFWHSLGSVFVSVAFFLLFYYTLFALLGYPVEPMVALLLTILAVVTQTPYNWEEALTDRLLLPRWAVGYRDRLILMRRELLTAPDPKQAFDSAEKTFNALVNTVRMNQLEELIADEIEYIFQYTRFDSPDVLSKSRLHELKTVQDVVEDFAHRLGTVPHALSEQQQADCLRSLLETAINDWLDRPEGSPANPEHIEQVILRKKYIDGLTRTEVEHHLFNQYRIAVTGGAYSRHLKQARTRLCRTLFDRELSHRMAKNNPI